MINNERKIDAIFNYETQQYYNAAGEPLVEEEGWDFPCPVCTGPAELTGVTAYSENHSCLNCGHSFAVN